MTATRNTGGEPVCLLPPSSAHIWGVANGCPGWQIMYHGSPKRERTPDQIEGIESRNIGADMIRSYQRGGIEFPEGDVNDDRWAAAKVYADDVRKVMQDRRIMGGDDFDIEEDVECASISPETQGKFNCAIMDRSGRELFLWVYRYSHTKEEEFENPRAICYVSGLMDAYGINGKTDQTLKVTVTVVQPRCFTAEPIRRWSFKGSDIRGHINKMRDRAIAALDDKAKCKSGPFCAGCDYRCTCNTAIEAGLIQYEACMLPSLNEMSDAEIARRYLMVKRGVEHLETLDKAYTQRVESIHAAGRTLPGLSVEPTVGARQWNIPIEEVTSLGLMFQKNLKKESVVTPTQAIEKYGIPKELVEGISSRKSSGFKIVPDEKSRLSSVFASVAPGIVGK